MIDANEIEVRHWQGGFIHSHGFWRGTVLCVYRGKGVHVPVTGISAACDPMEKDGHFQTSARAHAAKIFAAQQNGG